MRTIKLFALFIVLIFNACKKNNLDRVFENCDDQHLSSEKIILDTNQCLLSHMFNMQFVDSLLIVNEFPDHDYVFKIIDLKSKKIIPFGKKGRGPNEVQSQSCDCLIDKTKKKVYLYDHKKCVNYCTDSLTNPILYSTEKHAIDLDNDMFLTVCFNSGKMVGNTYFKKYGQYNFSKNKYDAYHDYKTSPLSEQVILASHPYKNKVAFLSTSSDDIDIVEVLDSTFNVKTILKKEKNGKLKQNGFTSVAASDEYIYALYSGKNLNTSDYDKLVDAFLTHTIYVFNWDGISIKKISLDQEVRSIAIDDKTNTLFAASYKNEPHLIKYNLNEIN